MEKYFIKKHNYLRGVYQAQCANYIIYVHLWVCAQVQMYICGLNVWKYSEIYKYSETC